jgi:hypothetical protein
MDLSLFYTRESGNTLTKRLGDKWWIRVRALNARERKQRDQISAVERVSRPKNEKALQKMKELDYVNTEVQYRMAEVAEFEYQKCIEEFCLPFLPKDATSPIDWNSKDWSKDDVELFLSKMPQPLVDFVEDAIAEVNKEGKYAPKAEAIKNDLEPSSENL